MEENVLWMDKYKPRRLEDLTFHPNQIELLKSLSENSEFPHLIFYGPDGAGKKTRVHCFLSKVYGDGIYKMNTVNKELKLKSKSISYMVTSSNYHLEFCPSDVGNNDKFIISNVIKETSSVAQLDTESQKNFKVIVLLEADKMTKEEIKDVLMLIKNRESLDLNDNQIDSIIEKHGKNVRECITCLQMTSLGNFNNRVYEPEYVNIFNSINKQILSEQSAKSLKEIRSLFMELLIHGFRADHIIYKMTSDIIESNKIKEDIKKKVIEAGALFDLRAKNGTKDFIHLEAFTAKIMMFIAEDNR